jgi:hypothetical protein
LSYWDIQPADADGNDDKGGNSQKAPSFEARPETHDSTIPKDLNLSRSLANVASRLGQHWRGNQLYRGADRGMGSGLLIISIIIALIPALMAFGCYRAGAFFDWRYQWRTRQEAPRYFWATITAYVCISGFFTYFVWLEATQS